VLDLAEACDILDGIPRVYDAFQLAVELHRDKGQIRLKALVSSAFAEATDLQALVAMGP
jgi:hypothetical protein